MKRHCNHCQKPYEAQRPTSRYCSARCRVAAYRQRIKQEEQGTRPASRIIGPTAAAASQ